mgnify:FL=1
MLETILELDQTIFFWINNDWHNPFLDWLMPYWRNKYTWIPFYIFLLIFALWKYRIRGLFFILALGATVAISDPLSSELVKKNVQRVRPCNDTTINESVLLLVRCGGGYSFTSSHATNHFAVAVFLLLTLGRAFRKIKWPLLFWAASIAIGQVYVGVHYPLDIIAGGLMGSAVGWLVARLFNRYLGLEKTASSIA